MRPIDADAARAKVRAGWEKAQSSTGKAVMENIMQFLDACPTIEAEPVRHGHWEKGRYAYGETEWKCSVCGETEWHRSCNRMKFCLFCGARMDAGGA